MKYNRSFHFWLWLTYFSENSYLIERKWRHSWPPALHCCWLRPPHCSEFPVTDWKWARRRWSHRPTGSHGSDSHYPGTRSVEDGMTVIAWGTHSRQHKRHRQPHKNAIYILTGRFRGIRAGEGRGGGGFFSHLVLLNDSCLLWVWRRLPSDEDGSSIGATLCHGDTLGCSTRSWCNETWSLSLTDGNYGRVETFFFYFSNCH